MYNICARLVELASCGSGYRYISVALILGVLTGATMVHAASASQTDPTLQCAEGVQLFLDGKAVEAQPLLEAGFAGRSQAKLANPDDLGSCESEGITLDNIGFAYQRQGDSTQALAHYAQAMDVLESIRASAGTICSVRPASTTSIPISAPIANKRRVFRYPTW
jgi:tetratricopeptide (TPR) repeat protein